MGQKMNWLDVGDNLIGLGDDLLSDFNKLMSESYKQEPKLFKPVRHVWTEEDILTAHISIPGDKDHWDVHHWLPNGYVRLYPVGYSHKEVDLLMSELLEKVNSGEWTATIPDDYAAKTI